MIMDDENVIRFTPKGKQEEEIDTHTADETLRGALGKFPVVVVIGVDKDGTLGFLTNKPDFAFMQWALSRGSFELNLHQRSQ